jgi:hypothetical protein
VALLTFMNVAGFVEHNSLYEVQAMTLDPTFALGPPVIIAAILIARRDERAGTSQATCAVPVTARQRLAAVMVAAAGPAALLVAVTLLVYRLLHADPLWWPDIAELMIQPVRLRTAAAAAAATAGLAGWRQLT